jgi:hypothetical protein
VSDEFLKAGFDHPCKQTCSGWRQGRERGQHEIISVSSVFLRKIARSIDGEKSAEIAEEALQALEKIDKGGTL